MDLSQLAAHRIARTYPIDQRYKAAVAWAVERLRLEIGDAMATVLSKLQSRTPLAPAECDFLIDYLSRARSAAKQVGRPRMAPRHRRYIGHLVAELAYEFQLPRTRNATSPPFSASDAVAEALATLRMVPRGYDRVRKLHGEVIREWRAMLAERRRQEKEFGFFVTSLW
ncbi:hypothetical protein [Rubellimicrobium sp. CFH 75288]|uniref:hypothetical protein n=1 Tax=Rubellimicrobium sp. CFH 75288 TaxID=2697034 RepID=UPI00141330AF|nr:hypothetical protein [Rubellimicrobium sp. CFH 75288]NAZ37905.1 hypothetical protein [Rubellimicrobium sp. CFH 75288]